MAGSSAPSPPSLTKTSHTKTYSSINPSRPELSQHGRNIVITGGGSGIGARTALSFAAAGAAHIAILGRRRQNLESTKTDVEKAFPATQVHVFVADITNGGDVQRTFTEFSKLVGRINVLINNAGTGGQDPFIRDADVGDWFKLIDLYVRGGFIVTQAFLQNMSDDAVLIDVSSSLSFRNVVPRFSSYSVSKAAAVRLFDCVQWEHPNVRVVHLHPGIVQTDITPAGINSPDDGKVILM